MFFHQLTAQLLPIYFYNYLIILLFMQICYNMLILHDFCIHKRGLRNKPFLNFTKRYLYICYYDNKK